MSRLTITEKEHWKERIETRIGKAIQAVEAKDPKLRQSIKDRADLEAHRLLGSLESYLRYQEAEKQLESLKEEISGLEESMFRSVLGNALKYESNSYRLRSDFWSLINKSSARIEVEILKESELGRQIATLIEEKESILDTVWLATSSTQIRDLWSRVSQIIGDDATPLQKQIIAQESASQ